MIPAHPTEKRPSLAWSSASDDEDDIKDLFSHYPTGRFGILTGPQEAKETHADGAPYYGSGVWVLDFDGADGLESLRVLVRENGGQFATYTVRTPSGGVHLYFRWLRDRTHVISRARAYEGLPGVDTRGVGGFVVCPPSLDPRGPYAVTGPVRSFQPAPEWLEARLRGACRMREGTATGSMFHVEHSRSALGPGEQAAVLAALDALDPAPLSYDQWRDVGFGLSESGVPWAEDVFHHWSRQDPARYDRASVSKIWEAMRHDKPANVTYRTILQLAQGQGWQNDGHAFDFEVPAGEWLTPLPLSKGFSYANLDYRELVPAHLTWLHRFIGAVAASKDVPAQMVLMSAMPALAMVVSSHFEVTVPGASWVEPLMLWSLTISESSSRKTPVIDAVTAAIEEWRRDKSWKIEQARLIREAEALEADLKRTTKKLSNPTSEVEEEQLRARLEQLSIQFEAATRKATRDRTVCADDLNPQSLIMLLQRNGGRLFLVDSEGDGLRRMVHGHTGQEPMLGAWLRTYDRGRIEQIRVKGTRSADPADVSMAILTQPSEIQETITDERARGRGLFARFMICYQRAFMDSEFLSGPPIYPEDSHGWDAVLRHFLELEIPESKVALPLSADARELFRLYGEANRARLNKLVSLEADSDERDPWQRKLMGRLLRISGVLAAVGQEVEVSGATMEHALRWGAPLEQNYFSAIGRLEATEAETVGARILSWLLGRHEKGEPIARLRHAEAYEGVRSARRARLNVVQVDEALELLCTTRWLRPEGKLTRGMHSQHYAAYEVHPRLLEFWSRGGFRG